MNCPIPTSRKNIGTPPVTRQMTYGIRNAPEKGTKGVARAEAKHEMWGRDLERHEMFTATEYL